MTRLVGLSCWAAISSLGESAAETALLLRAGLQNVTRSHFIDAAGERVSVCAAPALPLALPASDRLAMLALHALSNLWRAVEEARLSCPARPLLLLALPEGLALRPRRADLNEEGRAFISALRAGLPGRLSDADIEVFPFGRAAGAVALGRAVDRCADRLVVWGGVDTLMDWRLLERLEAAGRLLTTDNIDGVRPGEGAAFAVVRPSRAEDEVGVLNLGYGREPFPVESGQPSLARGLAQALQSAVAPLRAAGSRTNEWWLDATHEDYSTQALQNMIGRFGDVIGPRAELRMPLKALGDVGAAAMPMLAALGAQAWRLGHAADRTAVVTGCSDDGARAAFLLAAPERCAGVGATA